MSAESPADSRPPQTNSAPEGTDAKTPKSVSDDRPDVSDLPDPSDRVRDVLDKLGDRAHLPLSEQHGRELRESVTEEEVVREHEVELDEGETERREETNTYSVPVWQAVAELLDSHEEYLRSTLRLEYGTESDPTHRLLDIPLENSWMAKYQDAERAKLKALERQTCGYQTCDECGTRWCEDQSEHDTEYVSGEFDEPVVVLTGRTAAGDGRPPVDHARDIAEAWTGPNGSDGVARSLRYIIDEKLGLESDEWVRWTQGEPHTGKRSSSGYGGNTGYHHAHDIIILDAGRLDRRVTAETFRGLIESHVEKCDHAGREAHDLHLDWSEAPETSECDCKDGCDDCIGTVSVKHVEEEVEESVASYAASYLSNESKDLLERSEEYLMWAATMWATDTQRGIKSDSANHAIAADQCHHKHADGDQEIPHGAEVRRSPCRCAEAPYGPGCGRCDGRGYHIVCAMCGSPWSIDQTQTLTAHRTADMGPAAVADGGAVAADQTTEQTVEEELRDRWPSARSAAVVGGPTAERECDHREPDACPLCATETESPNHTVAGDVPMPETACAPSERSCVTAEFDRPPSWSAKSVIRDGEERPATGGSVEKKALDLPSAPRRVVSMAARDSAEMVCQECNHTYNTVAEYVEHGCEDGRVFVAWCGGSVDRPEVSCSHCGHSWKANPRADTAKCPVCYECANRYPWIDEPVPVVGVPGAGRSGAPAEPSVLDRSEFVEIVPDRLLNPARSDGEEVEESDGIDWSREEVEEFVGNHPTVGVVEVLGRFGLPPSARPVVEGMVE
mgnify:CR=1 FL=1